MLPCLVNLDRLCTQPQPQMTYFQANKLRIWGLSIEPVIGLYAHQCGYYLCPISFLLLRLISTSPSLPALLQRALPWTRCWPRWSAAASTCGRPSYGCWRPTRMTTPTTSWRRSGRASGWRRCACGLSSFSSGSSVTPGASLTRPTPWRAASTRRWGASRRRRPSRTRRTKVCHAPTGRTREN